MDRQESIKTLQLFVTLLSEGAYVHHLQGHILKSQGFNKLGDHYLEHYTEEMDYVQKFIGRILDLGGELKYEGMKPRELVTDPVEYIKADLAIQEQGVPVLRNRMESLMGDPTTYNLMRDYLAEEEEDLYWSQLQVELINKIGEQNWLLLQL